MSDLNNIVLMNVIDNDPFGLQLGVVGDKIQEIHIRVFQRRSRKYITTIDGLDSELDLKKILKFMKKKFSCNGAIKVEKGKKIVHLSGDQRECAKRFLIENDLGVENQIKIHGF